MTNPHLDKPGRCAWCGGSIPPGERFCSRYCGKARAAWANVPFGMALAEEGTQAGRRANPPTDTDH
jgi:Uncharacterized protein containing a Zn-ribbon (DUF2116)